MIVLPCGGGAGIGEQLAARFQDLSTIRRCALTLGGSGDSCGKSDAGDRPKPMTPFGPA